MYSSCFLGCGRAIGFLWLILIILAAWQVSAPGGEVRAYALWGTVRDARTGGPLPYANIRVLGTGLGTTTNEAGVYLILLRPGTYRIRFDYIGYRSVTLRVTIADSSENRDIFLHPTVLQMPEVTVTADRFGPAEKVILKAIASKSRFLKGLRAYQFQAYTKTLLRVVSTRGGTPDTVIGGILETQTVGYWKAPDKYKEVITARRQSANFSPAQNVFVVGRIPNLNDDVVWIQGNAVVGPTAPNALRYYAFEMLDTVAVDDRMVFRLRMTPKTNAVPLFEGIISIVDSTFCVVAVDVTGNEALDLGPIRNIRYRERFARYDGRFWLPIHVRVNYEIAPLFPGVPPVLVEQLSVLHSYRVNPQLPDRLFDAYEIAAEPRADRVDSVAWLRGQRLPLTPLEKRAYRRLDSLMTHMNPLSKVVFLGFRIPVWLRGLPLTSFSDFVHFNRVEGLYLGGGLCLKGLWSGGQLRTRFGYGFSDHRAKYEIALRQYFDRERRFSVEASAYRTVSFRDPEVVYGPWTVSYYCLVRKIDYYDYFLREGWNWGFGVEPIQWTHLELSYLAERHSSLPKRTDFSLMDRRDVGRPNPPIEEGELRAVRLAVEVDTRKFVDVGLLRAPIEGRPCWRLHAFVETANRQVLGGEFTYSRLYLSLWRRQPTLANGSLEVWLRFGTGLGSLPPQKRFDLPARYGGLTAPGAFRTAGIREFSGDRIATFQVEHNFGNSIFRLSGIRFLERLRPDLIFHFGVGWMGFRAASAGDERFEERPTTAPVCEVGFGLGRLLGILRFDLCWRLSPRAERRFRFALTTSLY